MKINRDGVKELPGLYKENTVRPSGQHSAPEAHVIAKSDQVTVSERSRQISAMRSVLSERPEVRQERIAQLKAAIANGDYHVDSRKLAEALLKAKVLD